MKKVKIMIKIKYNIICNILEVDIIYKSQTMKNKSEKMKNKLKMQKKLKIKIMNLKKKKMIN